MTDAQPLSELLDTFWEGDFTLHATPAAPVSPASEPDPAPGSAPGPAPDPAIAALGPSGIRIAGRDLATLLVPTYRQLTEPAD
ncbi:hypothetical protein [Saccharothrix sp. ST-888]|uniref:hypothetical protein n=1 Tax=Saccharothrix sp. ST-888 TaxID=1427391 RepID=UPI0005EC424E|nr:hypothetical protein [Saccharothrix sp. ST-888]KJK59552.1 hypothetical protein UK12_03955 [Saccharothrix sp. ST-888]